MADPWPGRLTTVVGGARPNRCSRPRAAARARPRCVGVVGAARARRPRPARRRPPTRSSTSTPADGDDAERAADRDRAHVRRAELGDDDRSSVAVRRRPVPPNTGVAAARATTTSARSPSTILDADAGRRVQRGVVASTSPTARTAPTGASRSPSHRPTPAPRPTTDGRRRRRRRRRRPTAAPTTATSTSSVADASTSPTAPTWLGRVLSTLGAGRAVRLARADRRRLARGARVHPRRAVPALGVGARRSSARCSTSSPSAPPSTATRSAAALSPRRGSTCSTPAGRAGRRSPGSCSCIATRLGRAAPRAGDRPDDAAAGARHPDARRRHARAGPHRRRPRRRSASLAGIVHALAMAVWFGGVVLLARVVLAGPGEEDLVHAVRGFGRISRPGDRRHRRQRPRPAVPPRRRLAVQRAPRAGAAAQDGRSWRRCCSSA